MTHTTILLTTFSSYIIFTSTLLLPFTSLPTVFSTHTKTQRDTHIAHISHNLYVKSQFHHVSYSVKSSSADTTTILLTTFSYIIFTSTLLLLSSQHTQQRYTHRAHLTQSLRHHSFMCFIFCEQFFRERERERETLIFNGF